MNNLNFFESVFTSELNATAALIKACPADKLDYKPHQVNRSACEIIEHLLGHVVDLKVILLNEVCDETLVFKFSSPDEAAEKLTTLWNEVIEILKNYNPEKWEKVNVSLLVNGKDFATMPRTNLMWFFLMDMIHHRGQLSSYVRPMGGKNPAVYGYSADTI